MGTRWAYWESEIRFQLGLGDVSKSDAELIVPVYLKVHFRLPSHPSSHSPDSAESRVGLQPPA